jgi:hypothetical protein
MDRSKRLSAGVDPMSLLIMLRWAWLITLHDKLAAVLINTRKHLK